MDDPAIRKPRALQCRAPIAIVDRSHGNGTTYDYLDEVSADWKSKIGVPPQWRIGAKGNAGVAEGGLVSATCTRLQQSELRGPYQGYWHEGSPKLRHFPARGSQLDPRHRELGTAALVSQRHFSIESKDAAFDVIDRKSRGTQGILG